jgi:hypothetical protein
MEHGSSSLSFATEEKVALRRMRTQEIQGEDKELARGAIAARVAVATDTAARAVCTSTSRAASDSGHLTRRRRFCILAARHVGSSCSSAAEGRCTRG